MNKSVEINISPNEVSEPYAGSLRHLRLVGAPLVEACTEFDPAAIEQQAFDDYSSGVREMIRTDKEFRHRLEISDIREQPIIDGKACDVIGNPMVDSIQRGLNSSKKLADLQPAYKIQAERDGYDLLTAEKADSLQVGQSLIVLSMEPKDGLRGKYHKAYQKLGYREGLSYLQFYSKVSESKMVAGSFSVDKSDEAAWKAVMAEAGIDIPDDITPSQWILHDIKLTASLEQTVDYVKTLRGNFYSRIDRQSPRQSVTEFVSGHLDVLKQVFNSYYPFIAEASRSGRNNQVLRDLAQTMLKGDLRKLLPEIRSQLVHVANSPRVSDDSLRTMESIMRYATVEMLRKQLSHVMIGKLITGTRSLRSLGLAATTSIEALNQRMAKGLVSGIKAGRSYGGCPGQVQLNIDSASADNLSPDSPQEAYGGYSERIGKIRIDTCVVESCPTRPRKVLVGGCGVCIGRCQKIFDQGKDPAKMSKKEVVAKAFSLFVHKSEKVAA